MHSTSQLRVGESVSPFEVPTLSHGRLTIPGAGLTHLQFRRFAGCPVCNLHLRTFANGRARLETAGVRTIAFFHSPSELMMPFQGALPFPVVPDPTRLYYGQFGVERSAFAVLHPKVVWSALNGLIRATSDPFAGGRDQTGLPADFLLDESGTVRALKYGTHADDQWSLEEVLRLAAVAVLDPKQAACGRPRCARG